MMSSKGHQINTITLNKKHDYPQASRDPYEDEQEIAQQKRRKERLKRKKQKRREKPEYYEDGDFDSLLEMQSKKSKNRKKKNGHSNLWYDERLDDESDELWQDDYEFDEYDE